MTMTSAETIRQQIMGELTTNWGSTTPIAVPNYNFTPDPNVAFIRPTVRMADSEAMEIGPTGLGMRHGVLFIQIFVPVNTGTATALGYADTIEGYFDWTVLNNNIIFERAATKEIGPDENFYQVNVTVPFRVLG